MKKILSNNVLALLALLFIITSLGMNYTLYQSLTIPTGKVTGELRFCINHPPVLSMVCDSQVYLGQSYYCGVDATDQDGNNLKFYDNTSLFDIGLSSGIISFTPEASQVGTYAINISVEDDSVCTNNVTYATLNLSVLGNFVQVIVNTTANITEIIDVKESVDTQLEIVTLSNLSNASLNLSKSSSNPTTQSLGVSELGKYITINASKDLEGNITNNIIKIFYTDAELSTKLLHELSLGIYYFNQSWQRLTSAMDWVHQTGLNTSDQDGYSGYVWANTSHLSIYALGGLLVDGASCSQASECYGGYCCSNICRSSACPVAEEEVVRGGGGILEKEVEADFSLNTDLISISLEQGQTQRRSFLITNTGETVLTFKIDRGNLRKFILLGINNFKLKPGETETVNLDFIAPVTQKPELYSGAIVVSGDSIVKLIRVVFEIESKIPIFDVNIELLHPEVYSGEELKAILTIFSMKDIGRVDVLLETQVRDMEGNIISSLSETLAVRERTSVSIEFKVPEDIKSGNYVIYSRVRYYGITGSSSRLFTVVKKPLVEMPEATIQPPNLFAVLITIQITFTMLIFVLLLFLIYQTVMKPEKRKKEAERVLEKPAKPEEKIGHDIAVLERDHKAYKLKSRLRKKRKEKD